MPVLSVFLYFCLVVSALCPFSEVLICRNVFKRLGEAQKQEARKCEKIHLSSKASKTCKNFFVWSLNWPWSYSQALSDWCDKKGRPLWGTSGAIWSVQAWPILWYEPLDELECVVHTWRISSWDNLPGSCRETARNISLLVYLKGYCIPQKVVIKINGGVV